MAEEQNKLTPETAASGLLLGVEPLKEAHSRYAKTRSRTGDTDTDRRDADTGDDTTDKGDTDKGDTDKGDDSTDRGDADGGDDDGKD